MYIFGRFIPSVCGFHARIPDIRVFFTSDLSLVLTCCWQCCWLSPVSVWASQKMYKTSYSTGCIVPDTAIWKEISSLLLSTSVVMWKQLVTKLIQVRQL